MRFNHSIEGFSLWLKFTLKMKKSTTTWQICLKHTKILSFYPSSRGRLMAFWCFYIRYNDCIFWYLNLATMRFNHSIEGFFL